MSPHPGQPGNQRVRSCRARDAAATRPACAPTNGSGSPSHPRRRKIAANSTVDHLGESVLASISARASPIACFGHSRDLHLALAGVRDSLGRFRYIAYRSRRIRIAQKRCSVSSAREMLSFRILKVFYHKLQRAKALCRGPACRRCTSCSHQRAATQPTPNVFCACIIC